MTNQIKQFLIEAKQGDYDFLYGKYIYKYGHDLKIECSENGIQLIRTNEFDADDIIEGSTDPALISEFESLFFPNDSIQDKVKACIEEIEKISKERLSIHSEPFLNPVRPSMYSHGKANGLLQAVSIIKKHLLKGSE